MFLIDSCGWIELFEDGPLASKFLPYLKATERLVTPTIVIYEVYKKIRAIKDEPWALLGLSQMQKTRVVSLDDRIAMKAADVSLNYNLPMADAIILATAQSLKAKVITSDAHFKELEGVIFIE